MSVDMGTTAKIHADVEAPDRIVFGLTARQIAIISVAGAIAWLIFNTAGTRLPLPVTGILLVPLVAVTAALALGRRDGLTLDAWLWAAACYRSTPRHTAPVSHPPRSAATARLPTWAPEVHATDERGPLPVPSPLRLPAHAIAGNGVITLDGGQAAALVAATTININLRTTEEQAALINGYARWLNSLTGPVQIVVSAQRVDLSAHASRVAEAAEALAHPALADAACDYADFLDQIAEHRDPLWRTITIVHTATGDAQSAGTEALRRAEHTAAALAALGAQTRVLDGPCALAVLTAAVDPYTGVDASWPRAIPTTPITTYQE
ncbi:MAG: PrgI family protein [Dactylosporangium sp.]|nr:PrgI family protein [Dactylosporangium sp.]